MVQLFGLLDFNGQVVWRLWLALFASRAGGHAEAEKLLHMSDAYALLLWQNVVSHAAMLSPLGYYASGEWLGGETWLDPSRPVLPG